MGTAIVVLVCLALVAGGALVIIRARNRNKRQEALGGGRDLGGGRGSAALGPGATGGSGARFSAPSSDVRTLKPGDVVNYEGKDYIVEGTLTLSEGGFVWQEHMLVEGTDKLWLSVEDDEGLEVVVWRRISGAALEPGPSSISHDGVTYRLDERGRASFTAQGSTGTGPAGTMEYADYENGPQRLSFERYGPESGWEIGTGTVISEHILDVYPGRGL